MHIIAKEHKHTKVVRSILKSTCIIARDCQNMDSQMLQHHLGKIETYKKMLRKISHMLSHDIRQPLTSIMGLINSIKAEDYIVDKNRLRMIEEAAYDLDTKIHTISDLTKMKYYL